MEALKWFQCLNSSHWSLQQMIHDSNVIQRIREENDSNHTDSKITTPRKPNGEMMHTSVSCFLSVMLRHTVNGQRKMINYQKDPSTKHK